MRDNGKDICKQLKDIRQQIASENDIPLEVHECHYDGPCNGTCPRRGKLSKAALVAGVTLSLAASACTTEGKPWPDPLEGDVYYPEDTTQCQNTEIAPSDNEAISINPEEM